MKFSETDGGNKRRETTEMHLQKQVIKCPTDISVSDSHQKKVAYCKKRSGKLNFSLGLMMINISSLMSWNCLIFAINITSLRFKYGS